MRAEESDQEQVKIRHEPIEEISSKELAVFAAPEGVNNVSNYMMNSLVNPILATTLGIGPSSIGIVLMCRGVWDAFTDPIMGYVSDNTKSRMGRRRPFVILGGLLMAIMVSVCWLFPSDASHSYIIWYFGIATIGFATAQTIFSVPYGALAMELSTEYNGRTRVQVARTIAQRITHFITPFLFPFCLLSIFPSALHGVRWLGLALGIFLLASTLAAGLYTKDRIKVVSERKDSFLKAIWSTARSKHFQRITFIYLVLVSVLGAFGVFNYYLGIYYVFRGDVSKGASFMAAVETLANVLTLLCIPLINKLCAKYGKHNALRLSLSMMIVGSLLQMVLLNPDYPYLMFVSPFFYSTGIVATFMVLGSMLADVVDADELENHQRREGLFSATAAFMMKTFVAIATGASGFLVEATGFQIESGADQADGVFNNMLILFSGKCVLLIVCLWVLRNYPLTAERVAEIQAELRRRGEFPDPPKTSA
ncbi:MFS transporter [Cerasicoccus frondis]|uniref:MFS transporter n=1 Tax=Cerasicoccus frondis TaxID=490090 RepID=UPI0028526576|nr:MFS transporter [Cerasicoccus frondis]